MWSRVRLVAVLLVATLIVLAGCSMLTPKANAIICNLLSKDAGTYSRNLGKIRIGDNVFSLPNSFLHPDGYSLEYFLPSTECSFVRWETSGGVTVNDPTQRITRINIAGDGTLTAVYSCGRLVGGVVTSVNPLMALAPYFALIGLVATLPIAYAVKKRRN